MTKGDLALNYFSNGYNCAQSVACCFAKEMLMSEESVAKIASGFGGGIGGTQSVCGAVLGMVLVINAVHGFSGNAEQDEKKATYQLVRRALGEFEQNAGTTVCSELLQLQKNTENIAANKALSCANLCYNAANTVNSIINIQNQ